MNWKTYEELQLEEVGMLVDFDIDIDSVLRSLDDNGEWRILDTSIDLVSVESERRIEGLFARSA